ncbi:MAG: DUF58 domain-containing protein [Candidatus Krumholzibacteria bacterium]|nr:DUF58 domain-containing protein [Candidatus Krumholzibacteria bacterium]MDP6668350.1 DUF58 domain-containing protein [Candidatus Krumholzibacteria bacterium]MDP6796389.1 DUF58 domain-containing protein [Candidatus Krumholzibacteria bacterium]MDP7022197.1 DUF58 domain-containing protein [Candidatus Krumholzibacteria bacterium]
MSSQVRRFLEPKTVSELRNMELIARMIVEGFMAGLHRSPFHGFSAEFSEYRPHNPGESARDVDWKAYARTDRHYVKLFEEETNLRATLLLDSSRSMEFSGSRDRIRKDRYASLLAAGLAWLLVRQQDAVGLMTFDEKIREILPPRSSRSHLYEILRTLQNNESGGQTDLGEILHRAAERVRRRGLIVLLSDLMDEPEKVLAGLKHLRHRGHEVLVFHILDPLELDLDLENELQLKDLETGEEIRSHPRFLRETMRNRVAEWRRQLERECRSHRIDYLPIETDLDFDLALRRILDARRRRS